ncbi:hypothetical protein BC834DRAFT_466984 [Gloeopeniophorella convolvens]|nr:hypothetical protein BC834DRAFT_466984 [Gloeopeniophorella convolvens]
MSIGSLYVCPQLHRLQHPVCLFVRLSVCLSVFFNTTGARAASQTKLLVIKGTPNCMLWGFPGSFSHWLHVRTWGTQPQLVRIVEDIQLLHRINGPRFQVQAT